MSDKDPAKPNAKYFAHVDFIVERAASLGLHIGLLPSGGKYWKTGDANLIFTPDNARSFGRFLGRRYRDKPIIWILGGDQNVVTPEERTRIDAMAAGLREGDGGSHLITFHPRGPGQSSRQLNDAPWLDFNMSQTSHAARDHDTGLYAEYDLALTPLRPTLDGEPRYEQIPVGFYLRDHNRLDRFDMTTRGTLRHDLRISRLATRMGWADVSDVHASQLRAWAGLGSCHRYRSPNRRLPHPCWQLSNGCRAMC